MHFDEPPLARMLAEHGAGLALAPGEASGELVGDAVRTAAQGAWFTHRAEALRDEIAGHALPQRPGAPARRAGGRPPHGLITMRVLFTCYAEKTHFLAMAPLAWALRTAGHEVGVAVPAGLRAGHHPGRAHRRRRSAATATSWRAMAWKADEPRGQPQRPAGAL